MMHSTGVLLFSMIGGYWVLERAASHKGGLKQIGQVVGAVILIVSAAGIVCGAWHRITGGDGSYGMMGKKGFCPYPSPAASSGAGPSNAAGR